MSITESHFGKTANGEDIKLYTLSNSLGMEIGILNYGGTIAFLKVPDKNNKPTDIVLGYDTVEGYEQGTSYFGALIGRCANRIDGGRFTLDGKEHTLFCNDGENHLHGGKTGFDRKVWASKVQDGRLVLSYDSPDGEEGYPGDLHVSVVHSLSEDGTFAWDYYADADRATLCNLTNHAYFNLAGHASGSVLKQRVQIYSDAYTQSNGLIPTGILEPVEGTPMDFRELHAIGERIRDDFEPLNTAGGYDHNWAVRGTVGQLREAAAAYDEGSGICLSIKTTQPGIQFYTGNFLDGSSIGKGGAVYNRHNAFCLETQCFPDAIHHPNFVQPVLLPGQHYHHATAIKFGVKK